MIATQETRPGSAELAQAIRRRIVQQTGVQIQALEVEVVGDRVRIRGCSSSFYVKQLALQGILDVIGPAGPMRIELNVQVDVKPPKSAAESTREV